MTAPRTSMAAVAANRQLLGATTTWRPKQMEVFNILDGRETLFILSLGRQSGKSSMAAAASIWNSALRLDLDEITGSRLRTCPVVSPTESQSRLFVAKAA